jgi:hypothetical protein
LTDTLSATHYCAHTLLSHIQQVPHGRKTELQAQLRSAIIKRKQQEASDSSSSTTITSTATVATSTTAAAATAGDSSSAAAGALAAATTASTTAAEQLMDVDVGDAPASGVSTVADISMVAEDATATAAAAAGASADGDDTESEHEAAHRPLAVQPAAFIPVSLQSQVYHIAEALTSLLYNYCSL